MTNTVKFLGVEMDVETADALKSVDGLETKDTAIATEADRDAIDERMADTLVTFTRAAGRVLASATPPTVADLNRMVFTIAEDGKCYADYRHAGKPRSGEPSIKFGGFTKSILASRNVKRFVKLGQHGKMLAEAADGRGICQVEQIPFAGQAQNNDGDNNHKWAGCDTKTCTVACHGDNANRACTYDQRDKLGADGWHVEYTDGKRESIAALDWNPAA